MVTRFLGMRWLWLALFLLGLVWPLRFIAAQVSDGGAQEFSLGAESASLQVQNIGTGVANFVVDYYNPDGSLLSRQSSTDIPPGVAIAFDQSSNAELPSGFNGAATVLSDAPLRAVMLQSVNFGGVTSYDAENAPARGYNRQYLPLTYNGFNGFNSRFAVQNAALVPACVRITYYRQDGSIAFVEPAASTSLDPSCPQGGISIRAGGSLFRNLAGMPDSLPSPFTGSVSIETINGAAPASQQLLTATADIWQDATGAFATYNGFGQSLSGQSDFSTSVLLPLVQKSSGESGAWSTTYHVSTTDFSAPASVTATYCCDPRLPGTGGSLQKSFNLQGVTSINPRIDPDVPDNFSGSVHLTSSRPIAALVLRYWLDGASGGYSAYTAVPASRAGASIWLPLLYKLFSGSWQSSIQIQVADGSSADIEIVYAGDPAAGSISRNLSVTGNATISQNLESGLPDGFRGSAVIRSNKAVAAVAVLESNLADGDGMASYSAYGKDLQAATPTPLPPAPAPSPSTSPPTPQPTPTPAAFQLFKGWNQAPWLAGNCKDVEGAMGNLLDSGLLQAAWVWIASAQSWLFYFPNAQDINTLSQVCPGQILWLNVINSSVWIQNP